MARAYRLAGRGVVSKRWLPRMERAPGMAVPNGAGPAYGGTGIPAQALVAAYGAPTGNSSLRGVSPSAEAIDLPAHAVVVAHGASSHVSPQRGGPTDRGDGGTS